MQKMEAFQQGKYVIGVSGGSDSMALLHMCVKNQVDVIVAHMNYHKRKSANRDENIVCTFCQKYDIPYECSSPQSDCQGNFQAYARKERYLFYQKLLHQYQCDGVLLAHHQDDVIETYLMQKQRGGLVDHYGMKAEVMLYGMKVFRPLLQVSKKTLEAYCIQHQITYGIDESNLSDDYTRNYLRHHVVALMNEKDRNDCIQEIQERNIKLKIEKETIQHFLNEWNQDKESLLSQKEVASILQEWIFQATSSRFAMSHIKGLCNQLKGKHQWVQALNDEYDFVCDYQEVHIQRKKDISYIYKLNKGEMIQGKYFRMDTYGPSTCAVTLSDQDYPITIRNAQEGDAIVLRFGTKKLSRFFIDRHIPLSKRRCWPVLLNNMGEIVMVPEIGCDVKHFSNTPNLFVLK